MVFKQYAISENLTYCHNHLQPTSRSSPGTALSGQNDMAYSVVSPSIYENVFFSCIAKGNKAVL